MRLGTGRCSMLIIANRHGVVLDCGVTLSSERCSTALAHFLDPVQLTPKNSYHSMIIKSQSSGQKKRPMATRCAMVQRHPQCDPCAAKQSELALPNTDVHGVRPTRRMQSDPRKSKLVPQSVSLLSTSISRPLPKL